MQRDRKYHEPMPDRAVVDEESTQCQYAREMRDKRQREYEAVLKTGINIESHGQRLDKAQAEYEVCQRTGLGLRPQMPWQTWEDGWEKVYG